MSKNSEKQDRNMMREAAEKSFTENAMAALKGRKIVAVGFLPKKEYPDWWSTRPPVIVLDDGQWIMPAIDPEQNEGGVLLTGYKEIPIIPHF